MRGRRVHQGRRALAQGEFSHLQAVSIHGHRQNLRAPLAENLPGQAVPGFLEGDNVAWGEHRPRDEVQALNGSAGDHQVLCAAHNAP